MDMTLKYTLFPSGVLSVDQPARAGEGERFIACGEVVMSGRRLVICRADVWACEDESRNLLHAATRMPLKK